MLIFSELEKLLGPPKAPKIPKQKPEPRRIRVNHDTNIKLGRDLLELRSEVSHNTSFGHAVRRQFDIEPKLASQCMNVARLYSDQPLITGKLERPGRPVVTDGHRGGGKTWSGGFCPARRSAPAMFGARAGYRNSGRPRQARPAELAA
jgi:hypothetical protein